MPSLRWASYASMVASVTNENTKNIMRYMSYAQGLQFRTIYWRLRRIPLERVKDASKPKRIVITG